MPAMKRNTTQPDEWLTLAQAAEAAGVSPRTIQYWQPHLKSRKVRRGRLRRREYLRSSVEAFAATVVESEPTP